MPGKPIEEVSEVWMRREKDGGWDWSFDPPLKRHELKFTRLVNVQGLEKLTAERDEARAERDEWRVHAEAGDRHLETALKKNAAAPDLGADYVHVENFEATDRALRELRAEMDDKRREYSAELRRVAEAAWDAGFSAGDSSAAPSARRAHDLAALLGGGR